MKYDLLVTGFTNSRAKTVVARHIAGGSGISLQHAMTMVEKLPVTLFQGLTEEETKLHIQRFSSLGIRLKVTTAPEIPMPANRYEDPPSVQRTMSAPPVRQSQPPVRAQQDRVRSLFPDQHQHTAPDIRLSGRKTTILAGSIAVILLAAVIAGFLILSGGNKFVVRKTGPISSGVPQKQSGRSKTAATKEQPRPPDRDRRAAQSLVDSAHLCGPDYTRAIKFYTMALSFNRYNLAAWYGLAGAYRDAGMEREARKTESEMRKLFGSSVFSINGIMAPYGNLTDMWRTAEGTMRIEYRTHRDREDELTTETYEIIRAVKTMCNCAAISLFASRGPGKGMLVHIDSDVSLLSFEDFRAAAKITFLQ
jgi:hypothetical protein